MSVDLIVDGATLSRLLFGYLNCTGNQYGLLLGEKVSHVEEGISDSQICTSNVNSHLCISSFLPWPNDNPLYSRNGFLNDDRIGKLLASTEQDVVGWYSFRHNSAMRPSLREVTLHKSLISGEKFNTAAEDFFFFLCTTSSSSNMSTFSCNHAFLLLKNERFETIPVTVLNLGDTTRKEYRKQSNITLSHCRTMSETLQSARTRFVHSTGEMDQANRVNQLATSVNKGLEAVHRKLIRSEGSLGLLEMEVETLRNRLRRLEQEEMSASLASDAQEKQQQEEQARQHQARAEEQEEEGQLDKLLRDLGVQPRSADSVDGQADSGNLLKSRSDLNARGLRDISHQQQNTVQRDGTATSSKKSTARELDSDGENYSKHQVSASPEGAFAENGYNLSEDNLSVDSNTDMSAIVNGVKKVEGQKTYSRHEPANAKVKSDPFSILDAEIVNAKNSLAKSSLKEPKSVLDKRKASSLIDSNNSPSSSQNGDSCDSDSLTHNQGNKSDGGGGKVLAEDDRSNSPKTDLCDDFTLSQNETLKISSSPTF